MGGPVAWLALVLLALGGCAGTPQPDPVSKQWLQVMQRGSDALARNDPALAEREYTRARWLAESIDDRPSRAEAVLSLAAAIEAAGRDAEALALLQALLASDEGLALPGRVVANGRAAALCLSLALPDCARVHVEAAHRLCAGTCMHRLSVLMLRARWALSIGSTDEAHEWASQVLTQVPSSEPATEPAGQRLLGERSNALRLLARVHVLRGQPQQAVAQAEAALGLDRRLGRTAHVLANLDLLAEANEQLGDVAQARQWRDRAALARLAAARLGRRN
jgi:tetratricopeptide (TPR) repeat protein